MSAKMKVKGTPSIPAKGRVLIDLPQGLGDQIMCFPLIASLKAAYPGLEITVFTLNGGSGNLLKKNPFIHDFLSVPFVFTPAGVIGFFVKRYPVLRRFFKKKNFDCVIVVHRNLFRSVLYSLLPVRSLVYNLENVHKTQECANVLAVLNVPLICDYSLDTAGDEAVLAKAGLEKKGYVLLDLYAQHTDRDPRQWNGFGALIDLLTAEGYRVAGAGINRAHVKDPRIADLVNGTSFDELLALVRNAKLVVSHDSGMFHFSYSLGTPVVGLYGPVDPADRMPWNAALPVRAIYHRQSCSPCIRNKVDIPCANGGSYICMRSITPDEVMKEIRSILG